MKREKPDFFHVITGQGEAEEARQEQEQGAKDVRFYWFLVVCFYFSVVATGLWVYKWWFQ